MRILSVVEKSVLKVIIWAWQTGSRKFCGQFCENPKLHRI